MFFDIHSSVTMNTFAVKKLCVCTKIASDGFRVRSILSSKLSFESTEISPMLSCSFHFYDVVRLMKLKEVMTMVKAITKTTMKVT